MTIEIILIIVGVIFLIGSCLVHEKLSEKDVDQIAKLGDEEIKIILEKKINSTKEQIDDVINVAIENIHTETKREMERESNEKIMAISEYSDTVLESMNKTHNEIMFLYSMLNDKQSDITELVTTIQDLSKKMKAEPATNKRTMPAVKSVMPSSEMEIVERVPRVNKVKREMKLPTAGNPVIPTDDLQNVMLEQMQPKKKEVPQQSVEPATGNQNVRILQLHRAGKSDVAIAKELNCGLGEVRLVLGLYKGDNNSEN